MGTRCVARANLLPEPKRFSFVVDDGEKCDQIIGTDVVEFGGSLYIYDNKEKVAIFKVWKSVSRKTPA